MCRWRVSPLVSAMSGQTRWMVVTIHRQELRRASGLTPPSCRGVGRSRSGPGASRSGSKLLGVPRVIKECHSSGPASRSERTSSIIREPSSSFVRAAPTFVAMSRRGNGPAREKSPDAAWLLLGAYWPLASRLSACAENSQVSGSCSIISCCRRPSQRQFTGSGILQTAQHSTQGTRGVVYEDLAAEGCSG